MHYYKRNLGDYAKKAGRLSMLQHGAYNLLIDSCYDREKFPSLDDAIDWVWASTEDEIKAVEFVLKKFFILEDGLYVQARIQDEIQEYYGKCEANSINGKKGGRPKGKVKNKPKITQSVNLKTQPVNLKSELKRNESELKPNHKPITNNHKPITINQTKDKISFDTFYKKYPIKKSKAVAKKKWESISTKKQQNAIDGIDKYIGTVNDINYAVHPSTYLSQERWNDEPVNSSSAIGIQHAGQSQAMRNTK